MALSPAGSPNPQPSKWSPLVMAMVGTIGTLFLIFSYLNILRRCSFRSILLTDNTQRRLLRDTNADVNDPSLHFQSRGLDSFTVQMIPVTQFNRKSDQPDKDENQGGDKSTECAICLGEYEDDEWVKTIPNCFHEFHVSCIDTWFQTHSSCPLCRSDVFDLELSVSTFEDHSINDVVDERSVFYQALRSHMLQNSSFARLES